MEFYLTTICYSKVMEDGRERKVNEQYLFSAMSYTEAEARVRSELSCFMSGEWEIKNIVRPRFAEVFTSEREVDDKWYRAKIAIIVLDEKTGNEKRNLQSYLVQANDIREAMKCVEKAMASTMADYELVSLAETPIMDCFGV